MTIDTERLRELAAELGFCAATTDIERHRQHNKNADYWLAVVIDSITCGIRLKSGVLGERCQTVQRECSRNVAWWQALTV